ncbi:uroporphyrinogen decarboxylase family protein [Chloroflexota bacterium]
MFKGRLPIKNAPYWYNTPFEDLDFEWTTEEKLEIERYCEKILKNIADEGGMTPLERFHAFVLGKDKDRMFMANPFNNPYSVRVLDSAADAIKPIDMYQYPKLFLKGHLATVARFGLDHTGTHNINYGEDMWGGQSKMIEYGNPVLEGDPPIKSLEDLEGMPMPDPYKDGLYPGYIWAHREMRRIFDEYNIPVPLMGSICPGPPLMVMMGMMGWTEFAMGLRKNPELTRKCLDISTEWLIIFGKVMMDEAKPDALVM